MTDKKVSEVEVMEIFMTKIFEDRMKEIYPHVMEMGEEEKAAIFKIWANGVAAGMELDVAIDNLKELE